MEELIVYRVQETLFENDYVEFSNQLKVIRMIKVVYAIVAISMLLVTYLSSSLTDTFIPLVLNIVFVVLMFILTFIYPKLMGKNLFKNQTKLQNTNPIYSDVVFTENHIYDNSKNSSITFEYSQIESIKETSTHFMLMITDTAGIIIRKDSFIQGDINYFKGFVSSKKYPQ